MPELYGMLLYHKANVQSKVQSQYLAPIIAFGLEVRLARARSVYLISPQRPGCISKEGETSWLFGPPGDNGYLPLGHRRGVTKPKEISAAAK